MSAEDDSTIVDRTDLARALNLTRLASLPLRVKVLSAVALSCAVALLVGVLGLTRLAALEQRSHDIEVQALVPSMQLAEIRRAFLQTRIDALADELLPKTGGQDTAHQAYLATSTPSTRRSGRTRTAASRRPRR